MVRVIVIPGRGFSSNVYVVEDELVAVIDAGCPEDFEHITGLMRREGIDPANVRFLVNTHCHYDHAGGDHAFVRLSGCLVMAHVIDGGVIERGDDIVSCAEMFGSRLTPVRVGRKLADGDEIGLGRCFLRVIHTPGHTAGSICLLLREEGILFSGDTVFADGFGRTDLPTGDQDDLVSSLRRLLHQPFKKLFPGHGGISEDGKESVRAALEALSCLDRERF